MTIFEIQRIGIPSGISRRYICFCLLVLLTIPATLRVGAQVGEARRAIAIGVNGGLSLNTISFDPSIKQKMHMGPTFGLTVRMSSEKYLSALCALQIEINYARLGWKEDIYDSNDEPLPDTYQRNQDYIQIPFMARLAWGKERRGVMFYFMAGPQIGYCIGESSSRSDVWTTTSTGEPDRPNNQYAQYDMPIEHKFDYGITGALGLELNTKIGHFTLDGRYYYGLSDIYGNSKSDVFARSNHGTISVRLSYLIDIRKERN